MGHKPFYDHANGYMFIGGSAFNLQYYMKQSLSTGNMVYVITMDYLSFSTTHSCDVIDLFTLPDTTVAMSFCMSKLTVATAFEREIGFVMNVETSPGVIAPGTEIDWLLA